ncbi:MAG: hypothetical protein HY743_05660, partial [Deltaproteobacteria bacterium]|nr:hypothetical protein [Deltaproteobacteria bacterium]
GCTVYAHRPAACRLFPIPMGSPLTEQGTVDYYFCRQLDYCRGFAGDREWSLASWMADQGFAEYQEGRQGWLEILLKRGLQGPDGVNADLQDLFAAMTYDLDQFRQHLSEPEVLRLAEHAGLALEDLRTNDLALLQFSYRYLHSLLLGEEEESPPREN